MKSAIRRLDELGFVVLPSLFERARVETVARAVREWLTGAARPSLVVGDRRAMIPLPLAPPLFDSSLVVDERLLGVLEALLGEDLVLNSYTVVVAEAGAEAQPRHRDHALLYDDDLLGSALPPHAITLVVPLVDLDERTGTTALVAGTHRVGAETGEVALPYVGVGGAFLMDYRLAHYGTPNASGAARPILYIVYSRPWFVDERNFAHLPPLALPAGAPPPAGRLASLLRRARP
jgi:ectoine hydroxylase-related dioxygenase (phytanoyl-CoA dioxygenase family)